MSVSPQNPSTFHAFYHPLTGTARSVITAPLALGNHRNIIYSYNYGTIGILKRYDTATGHSIQIVQLTNTFISQAQVSTDGQWILFISTMNNQAAMQMIRMDGQGLQTLFCISANNLYDTKWSPNQRWIAFSVTPYPTPSIVISPTLFLLDTTSGKLRNISLSGSGAFRLTWLDNTHIYLMDVFAMTDALPLGLEMLDLNQDVAQNSNNPINVFHQDTSNGTNSLTSSCWDFSSSDSRSKLLISQCSLTRFFPLASGIMLQEGPSSVSIQPAEGGALQTIYSNTALAITKVQAISSNSLVFYIDNYSNAPDHTVDTSQNGLWRINIDGSGLQRLTNDSTRSTTYSEQFLHVPWASLSRDDKVYAYNLSSPNSDYTIITQYLIFGSLNSSKPTTFASAQFVGPSGFSNAPTTLAKGEFAIAGWTTMV